MTNPFDPSSVSPPGTTPDAVPGDPLTTEPSGAQPPPAAFPAATPPAAWSAPAGPPPAPSASFSPPTPPATGDAVGFAVPPVPVSSMPETFSGVRSTGYGKWLTVILIPVIAIVTFAGGVAAGQSDLFGSAAVAQVTPAPDNGNESLDLIEEAWRTLHENYVDAANLDEKEMAYGAIRGMTDAVGDENHTSFLTADEAKAMDQSLSGTFVGIGVQVGEAEDETGRPVINSIIPNTPASESEQLKRGDIIKAVDGWSTEGKTVDEVVTRVRGPEGEPVTLTIERKGTADFDVTITRRKFDLPLVSWAMVPGRDVAMIRLEQFATGATDGVKNAIEEAKAAGATAIVFDLRGNPGGYVNEAIGVASQFVGEGVVYQSIDRDGVNEVAEVQPGGAWTEGPLVVLADGDSASSAEIVTGAIQDAGRGTVVGEKTFGTGTVLGRFDLTDGSSMRIGVERWVTRDGRPIWREGLEPDVKVELADEVAPVFPDDLGDLTVDSLADIADAQLLRALEELKGEG
ncbi:MAG TPA: S41 family peptidase [Candidatus Limnocylindrales bacterium]|nr:S41 family peptidase [Candidatus Limnocylindrales bacterium]